MVSKNNHKLISEKNRKNEKQRFALRKLNVGVASVLLGITFSVYGGGQMVAHADTQGEGTESTATTEKTSADQPVVTLSGSSDEADTSKTSTANVNADTENMGGEFSC